MLILNIDKINELLKCTLIYFQSLVGKVHLVINCLLENNVVLKFDSLPGNSKSSGLWRHNSNLESNTTLFVAHKNNQFE